MIDLPVSADARRVRALVYRFLATLYLAEPDPAWLARLGQDGLFDEFPAPAGTDAIRDGLDLIKTFIRRLDGAGAADEAAAIRRDFYALFAGPGHVPAPPWESVYRSDEHLLFDWPTHEVRAAYRAMGLRTERIQDADDHLGLELLFLALMDERAAVGDLTAAFARERMLADHIRHWLPAFCRDVEAAATTDFWRGVAGLTAGVLALDR